MRRRNTISTEANIGSGAIDASGSGMSPEIINDLAGRINQRLTETIVVTGDSRSRRRNEEVRVTYDNEDEIYIVDSTSNQRYFVSSDVDSCTCHDFQSINRTCRHMNAVNNVLGQVEEEIRNLESNEIIADINGSLNILRKAEKCIPDLVNTMMDKGNWIHLQRIRIAY